MPKRWPPTNVDRPLSAAIKTTSDLQIFRASAVDLLGGLTRRKTKWQAQRRQPNRFLLTGRESKHRFRNRQRVRRNPPADNVERTNSSHCSRWRSKSTLSGLRQWPERQDGVTISQQ